MLLVSDLHLANHPDGVLERSHEFPDCNSRALSVLHALLETVTYALNNNHSTILLPGDIFHKRGIIDVSLFNALSRVLTEAHNKGVRIIGLPGNHDVADRYATHAERGHHSLFALPIPVASDVTAFIVEDDYYVVMMPYMPSREQWKERLSTIKFPANRPSLIPVVVAHQTFTGAVVGPHEYVMREGLEIEDIPSMFALAFSGHYHRHQVLQGKLVYVGSLVQQNFGERTYTPGFIEVNPKQANPLNWVHVENINSPRFRVIETNDKDVLNETREAVNKDHVQIRWTGEKSEVVGMADVRVMTIATELPRLAFAGTESAEEMVDQYARLKEAPVEWVRLGIDYLHRGYRSNAV